jgi:hypothetical protein
MIITLMLLPICVIIGGIMIKTLTAEKYFLHHETNIGQSFYMAESGLNLGHRSFIASQIANTAAIEAYTHSKTSSDSSDEAGDVVASDYLTVPSYILDEINFVRVETGPYQGWYEYAWNPGDNIDESFTGTGLRERIRFRVSKTYTDASPAARPVTWEIVSEAEMGTVKKTHRMTGKLEGFFDYALLGKNDINEFIRGADQDIRGKVHANGNIHFRPEPGRTLNIFTDSMTATGKFVYGKDAVGRTSSGFTVKVTRENADGSLVTWPAGLQSDHPDWLHDTKGAIAKFGGNVLDGKLNAQSRSLPPAESFEPDGYYSEKASLKLTVNAGGNLEVNGGSLASSVISDAVTKKTMRNHLEGRDVDVFELDVSKLTADDYANGLIYSEARLILTNAQKLPRATTLVSQTTIFTKGDFNKELATQDDYQKSRGIGPYASDGPMPSHTTKVSSALITKDRITHLSKGFTVSTSVARNATPSEPEEYPEDNEWVNRDNGGNNKAVIEINAALVDGAPLWDEVENRVVDPEGGKPKPRFAYDTHTNPTVYSPAMGRNVPVATAWDDYVESLGSNNVIVKRRGSIVHMDNATLQDNLTDTNPPLGVLAWHRAWSSTYSAPQRDYGYDPLLKTSPPPFSPVTSSKSHWQGK